MYGIMPTLHYAGLFGMVADALAPDRLQAISDYHPDAIVITVSYKDICRRSGEKIWDV